MVGRQSPPGIPASSGRSDRRKLAAGAQQGALVRVQTEVKVLPPVGVAWKLTIAPPPRGSSISCPIPGQSVQCILHGMTNKEQLLELGFKYALVQVHRTLSCYLISPATTICYL